MWASYLNAIRLTLVWDRHDLAGLERMAQAYGSRSLLHPYGTTGVVTSGGARMLDQQNAGSVPTLHPARCPPAMVRRLTAWAAGHAF